LNVSEADAERRFGGLRRLYASGAQRLFDAHVVVVGIGGVGSWVAEALARSGVSTLTLIDMDHVAESNVNRQAHALTSTLGQAKVLAMRDRIHQIHPQARVQAIDDFVTPNNWGPLLEAAGQAAPVDAVVDACDQRAAKEAMAAWAASSGVGFVTVGAAGGKTQAHRVEVADLAEVTHDPLLAQLRQRLRKLYGAPRQGAMGVACVFSREPVRQASGACDAGDGSLNCHGYGSSVAVTAAFGMVAAAHVMSTLAADSPKKRIKNRWHPENARKHPII
jgi:tRNA threonylcarbamoyladenosine dehydratase